MINQKQPFIDRATTFSIRIFRLVDILPSSRSYWVIIDQLVRSATSIGANMVEAKAASSKKDYINFYNHALKSANETVYWLFLLKELTNAPIDTIEALMEESQQLAKVLAASIITMKKNSRPNL